jgi:hypothetical protein
VVLGVQKALPKSTAGLKGTPKKNSKISKIRVTAEEKKRMSFCGEVILSTQFFKSFGDSTNLS